MSQLTIDQALDHVAALNGNNTRMGGREASYQLDVTMRGGACFRGRNVHFDRDRQLFTMVDGQNDHAIFLDPTEVIAVEVLWDSR